MTEAMERHHGPALVTGAARRIGLAIAGRLAHQGRPVVLHSSRRSAQDAELAAEAEAVARDESLSPDESRARIRSAVETRYCGPA